MSTTAISSRIVHIDLDTHWCANLDVENSLFIMLLDTKVVTFRFQVLTIKTIYDHDEKKYQEQIFLTTIIAQELSTLQTDRLDFDGHSASQEFSPGVPAS